ncbi:MAG: DNA repair protein RadA [Clostridiales bacterium]|nr:DNA repair protein RadA [Clostridiales bacterium]
MAKNESLFFCSECGYESTKWLGQCPACKQWNTLVEAPKQERSYGVKTKRPRSSGASVRNAALRSNVPVSVSEIDTKEGERFSTGYSEFDRVLGGGIVRGSLILMGGDPGIGKSTLVLQTCAALSEEGRRVLYVSGEESLKQIKLRADRVGKFNDNMKIYCETDLNDIAAVAAETRPDVMVVDSIQTMYTDSSDSAPGSPGQVKESTMLLLRLAKDKGIAVFIIGHVTKEGMVAGPRMLEHMVDTVLYLEGEKNASYRILRGVKNRFGATNEIGVFEMLSSGMHEVPDPSAYMLSGRAVQAPGSAITCLIEGTRPIMMEIQALVTQSNFGLPRRTASGTDYNRVNLLMAVMEKRSGLHMGGYDAYVNVAGGMKATEPALDLAIVLSLASSFQNKELSPDTVCFGEVGLAGEVRAVTSVKERINEAAKLKFKTCILPKVCLEKMEKRDDIKLIGVSDIREAIDIL